MAEKIVKRLPQVKTLYDILPKGAEGGKEFARIVDLLLFHEARRRGKKITIFDDSSGDYYGLDSFEGEVFRKRGRTGYQYKFYPSPLNEKHRLKIIESLQQTAENQKKLKLKKWILVTPQDLTESATRKEGGDVSWFEFLRKQLKLKFEIEHWGHKNLLALFLDTPAICLFYYPELVPEGAARRKTIQEIRKKYNDNLKTWYGNIEFVGMSVYKQEAARGVPIENIYIPLSAVPEEVDEDDPNVIPVNPLSFLKPGARHVVLGDPGSGKSTLQRYLALVGDSKALQKRCKAKPDKRLPILITLRRFADEIKKKGSISLIDYILSSIQENFNLKSADLSFFEYYLESGQALLLFDGLDELPDPHFKKDVTNLIRSLLATYPGNTAIVTSRIVGYDHPFRFDKKEFNHQRLTRLRLPEIEQFVRDWYAVRIENKKNRELNVKDLIRILRDKDHEAIFEMAQNPLLLAIIALVHRIDAVLPDERVVLYQKCTETLLNTWHTWKYRDEAVKHKSKTERRNRQRMEAIAHWMHTQGGGAGKSRRVVASYAALKIFLTSHIEKNEKYRDREEEAQDMSEEFLQFVKERAGLLIEIGDNEYSFVHLTFQEYLTAAYITTASEPKGMENIWKIIKKHTTKDRWHEIIRLLIANLKSDESQEFLVEHILSGKEERHHLERSRLLGGLLLDSIDAAEAHKEEIFEQLLHSACRSNSLEQLRPITAMLGNCSSKDNDCEEKMRQAFRSLWKAEGKKEKMSLLLTAVCLDWPEDKTGELAGDFLTEKEPEVTLYKLFFTEKSSPGDFQSLKKDLDLLWHIQNELSFTSAYGNLSAAVLSTVATTLGEEFTAQRAIEQQMANFVYPNLDWTFLHYTFNNLFIIYNSRNENNKALDIDRALARVRALELKRALEREREPARARELARVLELEQTLARALEQTLARARERTLVRALVRARARARARARVRTRELERTRVLARALELTRARARAHKPLQELALKQKKIFWPFVLGKPDLYGPILDILCDIFALESRHLWWEALRVNFLPKVPKRITLFDENKWQQVEKAFESSAAGETEIYLAAWQLMFDAWLYIINYHDSRDESLFKHLARLTADHDAPPLRIAHCIRDLAYGDESRTKDLVVMVDSDDPRYREIFETCYWRPTPAEAAREARKNKK